MSLTYALGIRIIGVMNKRGGIALGKWIKRILAVSGVLAVLAVLLWFGWQKLQEHYVFWSGSLLPRDAQTLDISGKKMGSPEAFLELPNLHQLDARDTQMTVAQYEWLTEQLPHCRILWDIPIGDTYYSQDTTALSVQSLTDADIYALQYLEALTDIDTGTWQDHARILTLQDTYPDCAVHYRVELGGELWDCDAVSLAVSDGDAEELMQELGLFPNLESVLLTGNVPGVAELKDLQQQYPEVFFLWKMNLLGRNLETDMTYLDLSGAALTDTAELEQLLPVFPKLKIVRLEDSGLQEAQCIALAKQFPEIQFVFAVTIGDHVLQTDATEIDISNTPLESTAEVESLLPCFRDLQKVVMCQCGIPSEEMDALNKRHENIRFVWSVELAGKEFRTDAVHFTPNRWGLKCTDENIYDLRYCTDMVCVDVGHAFRLTNCDWVRYMPDLKYLILAETGISDLSPLKDHKNLIYLELFLSKVKDYSPLATCKALEDLNLCYTQGDYKPIAEMTWLKRLWWSGSWKARTKLPDLMPDSVYMEFLSMSSTGRGWREGQNYYDMRDFIGMEYMVG